MKISGTKRPLGLVMLQTCEIFKWIILKYDPVHCTREWEREGLLFIIALQEALVLKQNAIFLLG